MVATDKRRWRGLRTPARLGLSLAALVLAFAALTLLQAGVALRTGQTAARRGQAAASAHRLTEARAAFASAASHFRQGERALARVSPLLGWIPIIGRNLSLAEAESVAAAQASGAAAELASLAVRLQARHQLLDLRPLQHAAPSLEARAVALARQLTALETFGREGLLLPQLRHGRGALLARRRPLLAALRAFAAVSALAAENERYLLLIQNSAELRATGGLIGAWGLLDIHAGRLRLTRLARDTTLPRPRHSAAAPPDYLARYGRFDADRDWANLNMSPDFPTSARVALALYRSATGERLDGVVALDAVALDRLLGALGPITTTSERLNANSFLASTLVQSYSESPQERSEQLLAAARRGWRRLQAATSPLALATALAATARAGHLRAYATTLRTEATLTAAGVGGAVTRPAGDYLLLVEQNAGGNKLDYYLHTRITDTVTLDATGRARSRITVELRNQAPATGLAPYAAGVLAPGEQPGRNRTYASLYGPAGTAMLAFRSGDERTAESAHELGHSVFSWFSALPPQTTRTATLLLETAAAARPHGRAWSYRLLVQHQPQIHPPLLSLRIVLPRGARLLTSTGAIRAEADTTHLLLPLDRDRTLSVNYSLNP